MAVSQLVLQLQAFVSVPRHFGKIRRNYLKSRLRSRIPYWQERQIGQPEYIIRRVKQESGYDNLKVVATGGLGRIIAEETDLIQEYNNSLTLEGLRIIYEKNKRNN